MNIKVFKTKELVSYINTKSIKVDTGNFNIPMYEGFQFFSPIDREEKDDTIFIVCENKNDVVGVLKLGITKERKKNVRYVSYVDVHKDFRQKGVGTELYRALNTVDLETNTIINSSLTKMGKEAKLNVIFKREITKYKTRIMK